MVSPADLENPAADLGDRQDVLHRLAGQADHEVELEGAPAAAEGQLGTPGDLLVTDPFVDHVAQALTAGLGGEGETRTTTTRRDGIDQLDREGVDAGARQRDVGFRTQPVDRRGDLVDVRVVGGRKARKADLLVASRLEDRLRGLDRDVRSALAERPVVHPRLAEAAAARAAAHHLQLGPIEDDGDVWHDLADAVDVGLEVGRDAAVDDRGDVGAGHGIEPPKGSVGAVAGPV